MQLRTIIELMRNGQLFLLVKLSRLVLPFYKLSYVAALSTRGLIETLSGGSKSLEELATLYGIESNGYESLKAWLQVGIRLKEINLTDGRYSLKGLSAQLAGASNDALLAIVEEVATLHHKLILDTPAQLKNGSLWTLQDQDGDVIARSSRIVEPLQRQMINALFSGDGAMRLLEVGCGSGIYIRYAAIKNPHLTAIGVEMQDVVVEMTRKNMKTWGLEGRVKIQKGDIRDLSFDNPFDIVTLYNNIYYFPVNAREDLLKRLLGFLKPGGFLVLTTACQGGQPMVELLNLWGASTEGCGRLPYVEEMVEQLKAAGFVDVQYKNLLPGDSFYMFVGYRHRNSLKLPGR